MAEYIKHLVGLPLHGLGTQPKFYGLKREVKTLVPLYVPVGVPAGTPKPQYVIPATLVVLVGWVSVKPETVAAEAERAVLVPP